MTEDRIERDEHGAIISVKVRQWIYRGNRFINTDDLPPEDPDSTAGQLRAMGLNPENFVE